MRKENIEAKNTHLGHAWFEKKKKQQAIERKDCSNTHWLAKRMHPSFSQYYRIGHTSHGHTTHTNTRESSNWKNKKALPRSKGFLFYLQNTTQDARSFLPPR
jgi:IS1 family transposase